MWVLLDMDCLCIINGYVPGYHNWIFVGVDIIYRDVYAAMTLLATLKPVCCREV